LAQRSILGDGGFGVVLSGQDRGFQPRVAVGPICKLPLVDGALDRRAEIRGSVAKK